MNRRMTLSSYPGMRQSLIPEDRIREFALAKFSSCCREKSRQKEVSMHVSAFLSVLPYVVEGMLGIFAVTIIIIACIWLLNKVTSKK